MTKRKAKLKEKNKTNEDYKKETNTTIEIDRDEDTNLKKDQEKNNTTTPNIKKHFLISATMQQKRKLTEIINHLGGTWIDVKHRYMKCTHLVISDLKRTEKLLGALAGGKYILTPKYLFDSNRAGHFLDEDSYEWSGRVQSASGDLVQIHLFIHRQCCFMVNQTFHEEV